MMTNDNKNTVLVSTQTEQVDSAAPTYEELDARWKEMERDRSDFRGMFEDSDVTGATQNPLPIERVDAGEPVQASRASDESARIAISRLEQAVNELIRIEWKRKSLQAWALREIHYLDEVPQRLQQRLSLLLHF